MENSGYMRVSAWEGKSAGDHGQKFTVWDFTRWQLFRTSSGNIYELFFRARDDDEEKEKQDRKSVV